MKRLILALGLALIFALEALAAGYPAEITRKMQSAESPMICERKTPTDLSVKMFVGKFPNYRWMIAVTGRNNQELIITSITYNVKVINMRIWVLDSGIWLRVDELTEKNRSWLMQRPDIMTSGEENSWLKECATRQGFAKN